MASEKIFGMYSFDDDEPIPVPKPKPVGSLDVSALTDLSKIYYDKRIVKEFERQAKMMEMIEKTFMEDVLVGSAIDPVSETAKAMEKEEKKVSRWWDRFREKRRKDE